MHLPTMLIGIMRYSKRATPFPAARHLQAVLFQPHFTRVFRRCATHVSHHCQNILLITRQGISKPYTNLSGISSPFLLCKEIGDGSELLPTTQYGRQKQASVFPSQPLPFHRTGLDHHHHPANLHKPRPILRSLVWQATHGSHSRFVPFPPFLPLNTKSHDH